MKRQARLKKDWVKEAEAKGLDGPVANTWILLRRWSDRLPKKGTADFIDSAVLNNAANIILDQHQQIEQLAIMTTI